MSFRPTASELTPPGSLRALRAAAALLVLTLAGCASSGQGPSNFDIRTGAAFRNPDVTIVDVRSIDPGQFQSRPSESLTRIGSAPARATRLRAGDKVHVKIYDTGVAGLLSTVDAKTLDLGVSQIESDGSLTLPYARRVHAAGKTPVGLQEAIAARLKGASVSPQVSVQLVESESSGLSVNGAVNSAGRIGVGGQGMRLLDAVARAGGPEGSPRESEITVMRGGQRQTVPMDRLMFEPRQNIMLQQGDQVFVRKTLTSFTSFGAFKSPGEFKFEPGELTLAQAIARSGGLLDDRADPTKVYLLRSEPANRVRSVIPAGESPNSMVRIAYQVDMTHTQSFFLMQSIQMKKGDVLYAANSCCADLSKFFHGFQRPSPTPAAPLPQ